MKRIFIICSFLACVTLLSAQGISNTKPAVPVVIRSCIVKSSLPVGELTFMSYNLGADPNMTIEEQMAYIPASDTDATVYGDLYQWGRPTDGHEKRTSDTTSTKAKTGKPGHDKFIIGNTNWCTLKKTTLWGATKTANDPCPNGWRIPTEEEWMSIFDANVWETWNSNGTSGYIISTGPLLIPFIRDDKKVEYIKNDSTTILLFLPAAGIRMSQLNGLLYQIDSTAIYWSSTTMTKKKSKMWKCDDYEMMKCYGLTFHAPFDVAEFVPPKDAVQCGYSITFLLDEPIVNRSISNPAQGCSCRCVKEY